MRKFSNGASPVAGSPATKKFPSGMRFFENVAGGMMQARNSLSRRKKQVSATVTTFKPGWTCMTPKREERQPSPKSETDLCHEIALNLLAGCSAIHVNLGNSR